jgi:hypothetical protein
VDLATEGAEKSDAPIADLVSEALNDDRFVGWQNPG